MRVGATSWRKLHRHKAFWRITKALKTEGIPYTPLKDRTAPSPSTTREVAECIADSIETQCSRFPRTTQLILVASRKRFFKTSSNPQDDLTPSHFSEVQLLVRSFKTRKAPGLDGISNKAIKCYPQQLLSPLVAIFNACLQNCYFPPAWKEAEVIGIHKPGKPRDFPSYRPISLLSGLAKLFERVLKTRLMITSGKVLSLMNSSVSPRPLLSAQVLRVVNIFRVKNKQNRSCLFDVAKTFDSVTDSRATNDN
ncbi:RNA-directed DNA polymerase from mobile element jockey [Eumeta japonica]|uniref:RNA-directed DNA polymerase from mobile element jockey n=1 Tax=Eumeta variegata TaxID=151549 RepID=A0A4C1ZMB7_EUMVA|nr:RNA-directed DNA polymerase from mobile element jockey [Eumeta japonica]